MPILVDYNQFVLAAIFNSMKEGFSNSELVDVNVVRHLVLNHIRVNRKKFHREFGELVICCDVKNVWRKDYFPYYKIRRRKSKKESDLDWTALHEVMETIRNDIKNHFPYKVITVDKCEADDIIGTICHEYGDEFFSNGEKFLILSRDKDYKQLLKYQNVKQYDPIDKKFMTVDDAERYLKEMIIKGDGGDDIPNVMSPDEVFALGIRQKPITKKRMETFINFEGFDTDEMKAQLKRNIKLVDLSKVPKEYKNQIMEAYSIETQNKRGKLMDFFMEKELMGLLSDIGDF